MKMDYRRDLQHNYLVVETGEKTENYITRMMTENQVQGLLGCECRRMDQKKLYYYDITSKISLAEKSRLKKVKGSEVLLIIQGLLQVLVQLEEYLIPADQICLDWNYIYLDPVSCYPSFCCLPAAEKKLEQGIRELLEELLPRLDHQEQTGVSVVYELYQYAIQDTFLVMGLQSVLERRLMEERKTTETELQVWTWRLCGATRSGKRRPFRSVRRRKAENIRKHHISEITDKRYWKISFLQKRRKEKTGG